MSTELDPTTTPEALVETVDGPAAVFDRHLDVLAANRLAGAVSASMTVGTNLARFTFLNPYVEDSVDLWEDEVTRTAGALRASLEAHGEDARFRELIGELMTRSSTFADVWAAGATHSLTEGTSIFDNPMVGRLTLRWTQQQHRPDEGFVLIAWTPADAQSEERLRTLQVLLDAE